MRGIHWRVGAVVLAIGMGLLFPVARSFAEAPFFYDDLSVASIYDPGFDPASRKAGLLAILGQTWSQPTSANPSQNLVDQDYTQQYRLQWLATLDPRYSLLVELKGSSRDHVVSDDYFVKGEFIYQGLPVAMWLYGGIRVPEKDDFTAYAGMESMSQRLRDFFPGFHGNVPLAFRGYAELRYDLDETDPTLRLMGLTHTIPGWGVPNLTLGVAMDMFFQEGTSPRWLLEGHADYLLARHMARLSAVTGYAVDLKEDGEQRVSLGLRAGLF